MLCLFAEQKHKILLSAKTVVQKFMASTSWTMRYAKSMVSRHEGERFGSEGVREGGMGEGNCVYQCASTVNRLFH